jgi:glycosyltransferase involved in cell wall biosynthesis
MSRNPLVSIIIPTYNRGHMVASAIQSALDQGYPNKEIIVVDDGSTDNTEDVVRSFSGVSYVFQHHAGQAAARNNGWKHSRGVYVSTLDSDDIWSPGFLDTCIEVLEQRNLDFVFSNWQQETPQGELVDFFAGDYYLKPLLPRAVDSWVFLDDMQLRALYLQSCASPSSSLVLRASSIVNGWNEKMNIGDDWCMLLDLILSKKAKAAFTTQQLWKKQINCNNVYDGRNHIEVIRLLWVKDFKTILLRHKNLLTKREYKTIHKVYLKHLVHDAKHSLLVYSNILEGLSSIRKALFANPFYTSKVFSELFLEAAKRRLKSKAEEA